MKRKENVTIDVVIPICRPDGRLRDLLEMLLCQSVLPRQILLINTEKEWLDGKLLEGLNVESEAFSAPVRSTIDGQPQDALHRSMDDQRPHICLEHVRKDQFDHGGTRHMGVSMCGKYCTETERNASRPGKTEELILFLTQDAVPQDEYLIENLARAFRAPQTGAAYARQLPRLDCNLLERYSRGFNYPAESRVKTKADLPELGIKTFFCSNVCAMYRRKAYEELGGFERHTIFNEDMIFAAKLIRAGWAVAYCADAQVVHSHNYTGIQQLHRNFDLGVSQAEHPEIFASVRSESEGIRLVSRTARYLMQKRKPWLLAPLVWQSGCKYIGYRLGKNYQRLPKALVRACSMNKGYWK